MALMIKNYNITLELCKSIKLNYFSFLSFFLEFTSIFFDLDITKIGSSMQTDWEISSAIPYRRIGKGTSNSIHFSSEFELFSS